MANVPVPYPNELIYSVIARAGVNEAISSPKQLLDEVFGNRKVISTLDLPSHIETISQHLAKTGQYSAEKLIYQHTLFPFYAPFVPEPARQHAIQLMSGFNNGAVHMMLGVAASRVKAVNHFRFCSSCTEKQIRNYGETFWDRRWFLPGLNTCVCSACLNSLPTSWQEHRHAYVLCPKTIAKEPEVTRKVHPGLLKLSSSANEVLLLPATGSPSFDQWTSFYQALATDNAMARGCYANHERVAEALLACFPPSVLQELNLDFDVKSDTNWLRTIFRKHRKSFSALQHLMVWQALKLRATVAETLEQVKKKRVVPVRLIVKQKTKGRADIYRAKWQSLLRRLEIKEARLADGGVYAWLYRHDRQWLIAFNASRRLKRNGHKPINWHYRDLALTRQCLELIAEKDPDLSAPRLSKLWLINHLPHGRSCAKNLTKLPILNHCLDTYSESITDYQIRRLSYAAYQLLFQHEELAHWRLLRLAGLSIERITDRADEFLREVILRGGQI